jgi:hypothetical protein
MTVASRTRWPVLVEPSLPSYSGISEPPCSSATCRSASWWRSCSASSTAAARNGIAAAPSHASSSGGSARRSTASTAGSGGAPAASAACRRGRSDPFHAALYYIIPVRSIIVIFHTNGRGGMRMTQAPTPSHLVTGHQSLQGAQHAGRELHLSEKGVRLAQKMQVGPCIPVGI